MKHGLIEMHPPYATQIIVHTSGAIMLKFELERKQELVDMLAKAITELSEMRVPVIPPPEPIQLKGRMIPLKDGLPQVPVSKVVPDTGNPPMRVVAPPSSGITTVATCEECGASGPPSALIHLETCSSFKPAIDVNGGPAGT